jgi:uncharacterized protein (DUF697 family)/GTP-binding protein EngB required for normal cell division
MADSGQAAGAAFSERFEREFAEQRKNVVKPVILVMGATGAGKSSLVNMVFGKEAIAKVGAGRPVTSGVVRYETDLVKIFDSEGYESGAEKQQQFKDNVVKFIEEDCEDLGERVNMVWYCISQANHRVLDVDIQTIGAVSALKVPVAVVLTQADSVSDEDAAKMREAVTAGCPGVAVFEVSTDESLGLTVQPLVEWAYGQLDEGLRGAFVAAAKGQIALKEQEARKAIIPFVAAAAAIAATPIPFSDAPLLTANQAAMVARIAFIWNLKDIKSVALGSVASQLVSNLARTLAGNLVKLFPAAGSLVGGAINAGVATSVTGAVGYAVNEICSRITRDELAGVRRDVASYFDGDVLVTLIKGYMQQQQEDKA